MGKYTTDNQIGKFEEKILQVMGPLSWLWKGLEDIQNESSKAAEVPVDTFSTMIEQTTLLLGKASLSISYARRLNILKTLLKDPKKMTVTYLAQIPFTHNWNSTLKENASGIF